MKEFKHDDIISEINITPFVDVVLVLLIIFMVTAPILVKQMIDVKLPHAKSGKEDISPVITIVINKKNELYVNTKKKTEREVKEFLINRKHTATDLKVLIAADTEVLHGKVISVIDLVKQIGIENFAFNIEQQEFK